jgi:NAD(P)-dependent dehydrogenase (short-subunit alcohol dehydrogenase family)
MEHAALVTGADRGLGFALSKGLLERGWHVFAGQYMPDWPDLAHLAGQFPGRLDVIPLDVSSTESMRAAAQAVSQRADHLDLLISNAGIGGWHQELREGLDSAAIHRTYDVNTLGAIRMVEAFLPLTDRGMRRLAFVSSEAGSIAMAHRLGGFAYGMSKAALNMAVKLMFNHLRPEGYTFRLYYPGWMRSYMSGAKSTAGDMEPDEAAAKAIHFFLESRDDEDRLTLIGYQGEEWPF